ncbi:ankyrin repeat domain-containing protein 7 isoform X2 [Rattus norvegicus]|uniref:POTE ankyrin domain family member D n=1 Tax=Rattus norvegicus TaxID=10116 RepID=D3ZG73_RAT|nr:ankyrin repeat domain-containing protein 7 isoform X2 [Rattus norvegicus]|eukprot:XP_017456224.1 PREDICTED: ankyrin repeat domain-containing protein 7-like isoform X2 [Rattus norvegicus]
MSLFSIKKKVFISETKPQTPLGFCDGPGKRIEWKDCLACRCETADKYDYDLLLYDPDNEFHSAVCLGKVSEVQSLLKEKKYNVNDRDGNNRTALHFASCYGKAEIVNILMENDCEINALDNQKTTPLIKAVQMCEENIVSLLLEHGADPNIKDANGNTALHYAVYVGKPAIAANLLPYGANIEEKTKDGFSPLLLALRENQLLMAEFLIRRGADINVSDEQQRTTLMYAVKSDSKRLVDLLLNLNIDVFLKDSFSWNALRYAIMGHRKVARTILKHQNSIIKHIRRSNRELSLNLFQELTYLYHAGINVIAVLRVCLDILQCQKDPMKFPIYVRQ